MWQNCYRKLRDLKEIKSQSTQQKNPSPPSPKTRQASSSVTCMLVILFQHPHKLLYNKSVSHTYKMWNRTVRGILWHQWEDGWQIQPEKWCTGDWLLHHDSDPSQLALSVPEFSSIMARLLSCTHHNPPHPVPCDFISSIGTQADTEGKDISWHQEN